MKRRLVNQALVAACCLPVLQARATTEPYPVKPVRLLVPSAAGGGIDLLARMFAHRLSEQMGQQFIVENMGGAGGTIASGTLARAAPDGYTLIFQATTAAVNAASLQKLQFDPVKSVTPVSLTARFPLVMIANPSVHASNLREFIALLRAEPGKYSYGSAGSGTGTHLAAEWFKLMTKVDVVHIPYKGTGPALQDLLAGNVQMMFDGLPPQSANIKSGRVRALAVTTSKRAATQPDVPAMGETLPGYELPFWTGIFGPAAMPKPIVDKLATELRKAIESPQLAERLRDFGAEGIASTPSEFDAYWQQQIALFKRIIKDANLKLEGN